MQTALAHITDQIRAAATDKAALRIRGHGSKDFYGEPGTASLLDTTGMQGIQSYEPSELVITLGAGTSLQELEDTLAAQGQYLPYEPPRFDGRGTIGGMVAAGLSGPARANTGGVSDYVLGLQMVNGRGEALKFGGEVFKNVAGYDVTRLMVGSLGILGVMTQLSLKLLPVPPAEATLVFQVDQAHALNQLHQWGAQPLPLNASCWVRDDTQPEQAELLFVRLRGARAAVQAAIQKMTADLPGQVMDNALAQPDWQACRDMTLPFFEASAHPDAVLWRLSLPQITPSLNLCWPELVEWHGAQRWLWAPLQACTQLREVAAKAGGFATIFRAPSALSTMATGRFDALNPTLLAIHQRLKAEFDPAGIFNPGRMFPQL